MWKINVKNPVACTTFNNNNNNNLFQTIMYNVFIELNLNTIELAMCVCVCVSHTCVR